MRGLTALWLPILVAAVFGFIASSIIHMLPLWHKGDYMMPRAANMAEMRTPVFRFAGAAAFMGYAFALWQMSIWYNRGWSMTVKATGDGLIYALLTAGTFGWLWPR